MAIEFYSGPEPDYGLIGASVCEPNTSELNCNFTYIYIYIYIYTDVYINVYYLSYVVSYVVDAIILANTRISKIFIQFSSQLARV